MGSAGDHDKFVLNPCLSQRLGERLRLRQAHRRVRRPVEDQDRRVVPVEVRGRRGGVIHLRRFEPSFAEHGDIVRFQEVGRSIQVHRALHAAREIAVRLLRIEPVLCRRDGHHRREVAARRPANHADLARVDVQPLGVLAEPAHGRLAIVKVPRPGRFAVGGKHVVDAQADVAVKRQGRADVDLSRRPLVTRGPAAAVDDHDRRSFRPVLRVGRQVQVGLLRAIRPEVGDVALDADLTGEGRRGQKKGQAGHDQSSHGSPRLLFEVSEALRRPPSKVETHLDGTTRRKQEEARPLTAHLSLPELRGTSSGRYR